MKILSISIRVYFFIVGAKGLFGIINLFTKSIAWSLTVYASMFITLFICTFYLYFSWKLNDLLPQRTDWVQSVIFIALCNTLATVYLGALGQNQTEIFKELNFNELLITGGVAIVGYILLIYSIGYLARRVDINSV